MTKEMEVEDTEMSEVDNPAANLMDKFAGASCEWKHHINEARRNGWEMGALPESLKHWKDIKKRKVDGFLPEDLIWNKWPLTLKDGLKDLNYLYVVDVKTASHNELAMALEQDIDKMLGQPYDKAFKCLFSLSKTDPSCLPKAKTKEGITFVPDSVITELWLTSITLFGFNKDTKPLKYQFFLIKKR
jgi:hypothetical protein